MYLSWYCYNYHWRFKMSVVFDAACILYICIVIVLPLNTNGTHYRNHPRLVSMNQLFGWNLWIFYEKKISTLSLLYKNKLCNWYNSWFCIIFYWPIVKFLDFIIYVDLHAVLMQLIATPYGFCNMLLHI
jgi:hypothetical protein